MVDVSPGLLKEMRESLSSLMEKDKRVTAFYASIRDGTASFESCRTYANVLSELVKQVVDATYTEANLPNGKLYYNIAMNTLKPLFEDSHADVNKYADEVQKLLDTADNTHLKSVLPEFPEDRVDGIIDNVCDDALTLAEQKNRIATHSENLFNHYMDEFIQQNAAFRYSVGMEPQIIRSGGSKCCEWCQSLNGVYNYSDVSDTGNAVFRRHENCKCSVIYKNNKMRYLQGAHSKRSYSGDTDKLNARMVRNLDTVTKLTKEEARALNRARRRRR